ncbi:MAG TPA: autotransporter [Solirubrobacteraceae bacterium]|nr:autotransporter [Solirubrobacteraceae bacterium]
MPLALASLAAGATAQAAGPVVARISRSLTVNDEGHLHLVGESGAYLIEEGRVSGTLVGRVRVSFDVGTSVSASFVLYPNGGGSLTGHGVGKLRSSGRYASFGGSMSVSSGTGRFSHASGQGGLYGTILREGSFPVVVQTRGTLRY